MTVFTHMHFSDYSQVLHAQQDSLVNIQLLLASTKLHEKNYLGVFSTCQQSLTSSVFLVSHEPNMWVGFKISRGTMRYSHFFVNLAVSCTVATGLMNLLLDQVHGGLAYCLVSCNHFVCDIGNFLCSYVEWISKFCKWLRIVNPQH